QGVGNRIGVRETRRRKVRSDGVVLDHVPGPGAGYSHAVPGVPGYAIPRTEYAAADRVPGGPGIDPDAATGVGARGGRVRIRADVVAEDRVAIRAGGIDQNSVAGVAGDDVAVGRVRTADRVQPRRTQDLDAVRRVRQFRPAGVVGADQVTREGVGVCPRGDRD